jgi:PST family polysaccharide transporter
MSEEQRSYGQIFRSSSIIGGAQIANNIIGLLRVKAIALIVGPAGVGLFGIYTSAMALVGAMSDFGVSASAVREIARANGTQDLAHVAHTFRLLRRICWATGFFGWMVAILFRSRLSVFMTGSDEHGTVIALLGSTLLLTALNTGQIALLQGLRRIGDVARANLWAALLGSVAAITVIFILGQPGVAPAIFATSVAALGCSYWFVRQANLPAASDFSWRETWEKFRGIAGLGLALMWSAIMTAGLDMMVRSVIMRQYGVEATGIFQAAWTLTGVLANVVVAAMATDFFPRLMGVIHDRSLAAKTVDQQTEIGILLALPGLLFLAAFSPLVVETLYSQKFQAAGQLLQWMALGAFCRVLSWPLGYVQLARGESILFGATQTVFVFLQAALTFWMLDLYGIVGAAYAFTASYAAHLAILFLVARSLLGAAWSGETFRLVAVALALLGGAATIRVLASGLAANLGESAIVAFGAFFSLRGLACRLSHDHRLIKLLLLTPGGRHLLAGTSLAGTGNRT